MLYFQDMIQTLQNFWGQRGCAILQPLDNEVGAGTFHPATFLRAVLPAKWNAVYVQPSRRPQDGRYGDNPNRLQHYYQLQVVMKPSPDNIQDLYYESLAAIGVCRADNDIRFVEDDWESPTLGAWGMGWEVWMNGMEISQFTYFQEVGGIAVAPVMGEITYGLERLAMFLQNKENVFDLAWCAGVSYGDVYHQNEREHSAYNFDEADIDLQMQLFESFEKESLRLADKQLALPAYDMVMKCSHAFNILDARGCISVTERTKYIARVRRIAKRAAQCYRDTWDAANQQKQSA